MVLNIIVLYIMVLYIMILYCIQYLMVLYCISWYCISAHIRAVAATVCHTKCVSQEVGDTLIGEDELVTMAGAELS